MEKCERGNFMKKRNELFRFLVLNSTKPETVEDAQGYDIATESETIEYFFYVIAQNVFEAATKLENDKEFIKKRSKDRSLEGLTTEKLTQRGISLGYVADNGVITRKR